MSLEDRHDRGQRRVCVRWFRFSEARFSLAVVAIAVSSCRTEPKVSTAECGLPQTDYTQFDIPAAMTNASESRRTFADAYERAIVDKAKESPRRMWLALSLNETGGVYKSEVETSSGSSLHDSIAVDVSRTFEFKPAHKGRTPVCVRISVPINFPPES